MLAADFHVHAFPGDGGLTPLSLRNEAARKGLDIIAITNHNQIITGWLAQWIGGKTGGPIVIAGEEITNPDYHLIAVGLSRAVRPDQTAKEAIDAIHAQGAVAIAAHPLRSFRGFDEAALAAVDGTEVAHPITRAQEGREYVEVFERARHLHPQVAPIGSSDVHVTPFLGACRTIVFARERSVNGVMEAIRAGRTVAVDQSGTLYGSPDLLARVRSVGGIPLGYPKHPGWQRISLVLTWLGLAGILLLK
jgi:predicted metal-dependent phosphoesterase TrpH